MQKQMLQARWNQVRRQLQIWWGTLSPQKLGRIFDNPLSQVGMRPQQYGYAMQHLESQRVPWLRAQRSSALDAE